MSADLPGGPPRRPATVLLFRNGIVAVFDENSAQIPELQGHFKQIANMLADAVDDHTEILVARARGSILLTADQLKIVAEMLCRFSEGDHDP